MTLFRRFKVSNDPAFHLWVVCAWLHIWAALPAGEAAAPGDRATVTLTVPYRTVLEEELIRFTVRLRNASKDKLPYIGDSDAAAGKQVFINVQRGVVNFDMVWVTDSRPGLGRPMVRKIELDGKWEIVAKEATAALLPGQTAEWDGSRFDPILFYITMGKPISIQAQVLIGPGQWVNSEAIPIKVLAKDIASTPVVFEAFYRSPARKDGVLCPVKVHRINIEGNEYLFSGSGRICEVPKGVTPQFASDPETAVLTVRFPGTDVAPIRYHYPQMRVLPAASADTTPKP